MLNTRARALHHTQASGPLLMCIIVVIITAAEATYCFSADTYHQPKTNVRLASEHMMCLELYNKSQ